MKRKLIASNYTIDFSKALLIFKPKIQPKFSEVIVEYTSYPDFLTKTYTIFD